MRRIRFIATQPHEVLGAVRHQGDVLEVDDEIAADLLRRSELFEDAESLHAAVGESGVRGERDP